MSPQEFVSVIAGAHLVISASFCLAMAIVLERPFVAILTGNIGKDERFKSSPCDWIRKPYYYIASYG